MAKFTINVIAQPPATASTQIVHSAGSRVSSWGTKTPSRTEVKRGRATEPDRRSSMVWTSVIGCAASTSWTTRRTGSTRLSGSPCVRTTKAIPGQGHWPKGA